MKNKELCCVCGLQADYIYMPGDSENMYYCKKCVPKGCSCNNMSFHNFEGPKEELIKEFLDMDNLKLVNYGNPIHEIGKELEEITDRNLIKALFNNLTKQELLDYEIIPLDKNGEEFPCCEYMPL